MFLANSEGMLEVCSLLSTRFVVSAYRLQKEELMRIPLKRYLALLVTYLKPQWYRTPLMAVFLLPSVGLRLLSPR